MIEPKVLKGFRDYLPHEAIARSEMINKLQKVFASFGFAPIDTPALEYTEILLGKGGDETDKQLYRFQDNGDRDVSLRFDLTIPLARYVATHINELGTPFKRYHIAPVWRAEKPQRGRYREFIQCDFDIVGTKSIHADSEIINVIHAGLSALEINHLIKINHRGLLNSLLAKLGVEKKSTAVLRAIDKLAKLGKDNVGKELGEVAGLDSKQIAEIFSFIAISENANAQKCLADVEKFLPNSPAIAELTAVLENLESAGVNSSCYKIDLSITRGLDYYTGLVFETIFTDLPEIGSICGGGRYDNLVSVYSKKELPGVGAAIGLDRIMAGLLELNRLSTATSTAKVLVAVVEESCRTECVRLAETIRKSGINVELFIDQAKLGNQLKYANRKGINWAVIAGPTELSSNTVSLKNLSEGSQEDNLSLQQAIEKLS